MPMPSSPVAPAGVLKLTRFILLGTACTIGGGVVLAADLTPAPESNAGFFGYIEGGYIFKTDSNNRQFVLDGGEGSDSETHDDARTGDGWDGSVKLGYRFDNNWDVAIGGRYFDQASGKRNDDEYDWQNTDGKYWNGDLEVGYSYFMNDAVVRPFLGLRYQDWKSEFTDNIGSPTYAATNKSWGVGPRIGFDGSYGISEQVRLFGGADASVLFGKIKADASTDDYFDDTSDNRTFWTVGAKIGLGWAITPSMELGAGYKVDWLDGINYATFSDESHDDQPHGRGGELIHGPFARLSFSFP